MADKSTPLILAALTKAMADPGGVPLHAGRKMPGLFAASATAKQAAQRCLEQGYLRILQRQTNGKSVQDLCTLSEKGLAHLLSQVNPRSVLEELIRTLQAQQTQVAELIDTTQHWQAGLDALRTNVSTILEQIQLAPSDNGSTSIPVHLVACLSQWQASQSPGDCPLPELYRRIHAAAPYLTIGRFHDALRQLHQQERIYLHPWSGPLYEIPEPPYAMLIGHEVAYYASIR